jgi:hypothetical protein
MAHLHQMVLKVKVFYAGVGLRVQLASSDVMEMCAKAALFVEQMVTARVDLDLTHLHQAQLVVHHLLGGQYAGSIGSSGYPQQSQLFLEVLMVTEKHLTSISIDNKKKTQPYHDDVSL